MSVDTVKPICGIVMPISAIDGCSEGHWSDVRHIIAEAVEEAGFDAQLVSDADDSGIIQKRIIQNLYDNPIVVCDVSGKNPNVMFELGIRLAFDKPTIIIKDDATSYSFDTSAIEHVGYPRDLRFNSIVEFKAKLVEKITATHLRAQTDQNYTTFLKHFGEFKVAKLEKKEITGQEYIIEEIRSLRRDFLRADASRLYIRNSLAHAEPANMPIGIFKVSSEDISAIESYFDRSKEISSYSIRKIADDTCEIYITTTPDAKIGYESIRSNVREILARRNNTAREPRKNRANTDAPG